MLYYFDILFLGNREYDKLLAELEIEILDGDLISLVGLPQPKVDEIIEALDEVNPYGYTLGLRGASSSSSQP
ncbi:MAG: hypothetical protein EON54_25685 [Alcaligenaceae bacterium]|nr:MAG: hypothetical protein EON54_25685 [Alcaligenaceae bacterium]